MAPEQIEAFLDPDRWGSVGAAADIYSLGLVLRELLTGQLPDLPKKGVPAPRAMREFLERRRFFDVSVRRFNPAIPPSLEAIVAKCLALSPDDRYLNAECLAKDLERFLNHQPLLAAGNPSRRERIANYVKRQRPRAVRAGLLGVAALVLGVALARPLVDSMAPTLESSPAFQAVVAAIEDGEAEGTIGPLSDLVQRFPQSCLVHFYLAFANKVNKPEAEKWVRKALALPDVERTLLTWSPQHPEFCSLLVDVAEDRISRADWAAVRCDVDDPRADEEERDTELRKPGYEIAQQVLLVAEKLDPTSLRIERLLATTELIFGPYKLAYRRLTHVIDSTPLETEHDKSDQFFCRKLRGKVACLRVESDRRTGKLSSIEMLESLAQAKKDLDFCVRYLNQTAFNVDSSIKEYYVHHDCARTMLSMAEVEMDLGKCKDAKKHLSDAQRLIRRLNEDRLSGLRVPKPATLTKRFKDGSVRLGSLDPEGVASSGSPKQNRDQSSKNRPSEG
jgi:hypothetical protein